MKYKHNKLALLIILVGLALSCTKEGPVGATGATGPQGPQGSPGPGTIKTREIILPVTAWSWSSSLTMYLASRANPDITSDVVSKGLVVAYLKNGIFWQKLPITDFSSSGRVYTYKYIWSLGGMTFAQGFNDGTRNFSVSQDTLRIVTIY